MREILINFWYLWLLIILTFIYRTFKPVIKGKIGEKSVAMLLSRLDVDKYKVINDVLLRVGDKTSQIDHIVVSNYGVFVIETKNYKGLIFGNENSQYWTQQIYKRKEKLYNPILQNRGHVKALEHHLEGYPSSIYIPIVVFSVNAELKVNTVSEVVYTSKLLKTIKKYDREILSSDERDEIYSKILSININGKEEMKKHVNAIKQEGSNRAQKVREGVCPRCGSKLVERRGRYGKFLENVHRFV